MLNQGFKSPTDSQEEPKKISGKNVGARLAAPNEIAKLGRASPASTGKNTIKMGLGNSP